MTAECRPLPLSIWCTVQSQIESSTMQPAILLCRSPEPLSTLQSLLDSFELRYEQVTWTGLFFEPCIHPFICSKGVYSYRSNRLIQFCVAAGSCTSLLPDVMSRS
jgi:hypothetical protein